MNMRIIACIIFEYFDPNPSLGSLISGSFIFGNLGFGKEGSFGSLKSGLGKTNSGFFFG